MIDALHISESGLQATQKWIDSLSNNIANMNTAGYKKTSVSFKDMVSSSSESSASDLIQAKGLGTSISDNILDFSVGNLRVTDNPMEISISGNGFFEVTLDDGSLGYTRLGQLMINEDGLLSIDEFVLTDQIRVPPGVESLIINRDGTVTAIFDGADSILELGRIHVANINNTSALTRMGGAVFKLDENLSQMSLEVPGENGVGEITQGAIEMSNVTLVDEMTSLVLAQRAYQLNARIIQTADQVLETINNLRR